MLKIGGKLRARRQSNQGETRRRAVFAAGDFGKDGRADSQKEIAPHAGAEIWRGLAGAGAVAAMGAVEHAIAELERCAGRMAHNQQRWLVMDHEIAAFDLHIAHQIIQSGFPGPGVGQLDAGFAVMIAGKGLHDPQTAEAGRAALGGNGDGDRRGGDQHQHRHQSRPQPNHSRPRFLAATLNVQSGESGSLFVFAEAVGDEGRERVKRCSGAFALGLDLDLTADAGAKHHQVHQRSAVGGVAVFAHSDPHIAELQGQRGKLARGAGMQAALIDDRHKALHWPAQPGPPPSSCEAMRI